MTCSSPRPGDRGLSPVIGTVLLVAIAVMLVGIAGASFLALADDKPPAPTVKFTLERADGGGYTLQHANGDVLDGDRVTIQGIDDPETLAGRELRSGDSALVVPRDASLRIVWTEDTQDEPVSYTLRTFEVDPAPPSFPAAFGDGAVFTGDAGDIKSIAGDGRGVEIISTDAEVAALGSPDADVTRDGTADLPFVDESGTVRVAGPDGGTTTVATSAGGDDPATDKTVLATGRWQGSPASVFYVDEDHEAIYRATPGGSSQEVAAPGDGAQGVVSIGDIDGDGDDELVFADASQEVRYLEPDGTVETTGVTSGSNNGIGPGSLTDFDDDGSQSVVLVDGSKNLRLVDATGARTIENGDVDATNAPQATKSPVSVADVDGDDDAEIVYVDQDSGDLHYLDEVGGAGQIEIETLEDADGDSIDGSDETGVT